MKEVSRYTLAYILWAASVLLSGAIGLIAQGSLINLLAFLASPLTANDKRADFYIGLQIRAADTWSYVVLGLLIVAVIAFVEHYYRTGVAQHRLLIRFLMVTSIQMMVLSLAHLTNFIIGISIGAVGWMNVFLPLIEIILTAVFFWLNRRLRLVKAELD